MIQTLKLIFRSPFRVMLAVDAALGLGVLYWWLLSKTTTFVTFTAMYGAVPQYFIPYVTLTALTLILFGANVAVAAYAWQHSRLSDLRAQGGGALGALVGALAAACPTCGAFLLSSLGVTAGLAALPLKGLELKLASVLVLAGALVVSLAKIARHGECEACRADPEHASKKHPGILPNVIAFAVLLVIAALSLPLARNEVSAMRDNAFRAQYLANTAKADTQGSPLYRQTVQQVLPAGGFRTPLALGDIVPKLVSYGVIDPVKFERLYAGRGIGTSTLETMLREASATPITVTAQNSGVLLNVFWPLGLSNKMQINDRSPVRGSDLFNFASTGGWTLGKEKNGGAYFNTFPIVRLTPAQEQLVLSVAQNTYRPCCDNSTFFQDCNHGSALLGALELGASLGMTESELYRLALELNSFWFPDTYVQTALLLKMRDGADWGSVDPRRIMSAEYSSASGWAKNVGQPFQDILKQNPDLLPANQGGGGCGV